MAHHNYFIICYIQIWDNPTVYHGAQVPMDYKTLLAKFADIYVFHCVNLPRTL
jgi:hypothetical protein